MPALISIQVRNFRGVVAFDATPNGKSVTIRGKNGAGKSSVIDSLFWALGGALDGEVVHNGAERAEVDLRFGDYLVRRQQAKGKKPTLTVTSADGKSKFTSPTALLADFIGAIERQTFSARKPAARADIIRKLAPGLDCSDLDGERARIFEERTGVNRDAKTLRAQAEGVAVPADVEMPGEERAIVDVVDVAVIAGKKGEAAQKKAENDRQRAAVSDLERQAKAAVAGREALDREIAALEEQMVQRRAARDRQQAQVERLALEHAEKLEDAAALVDPDTSAIDAEIAAARETNRAARAETETHNRAVRAAQQAHAEHLRAAAERARVIAQAEAKEAAAKKMTARIDALDAEKAQRTAAAKLPIAGLAMSGDLITLDVRGVGPVEIDALNTARRISLDVAIAAALGHRLIAVRDASLLDSHERAGIDAFAAERGVQLLAEVVASGEPLSAVIEEGGVDAATQEEIDL